MCNKVSLYLIRTPRKCGTPTLFFLSQKKKMLSPQDNYKVVISYDFGTTFSGASYAFTHTTQQSHAEVFDVQKW